MNSVNDLMTDALAVERFTSTGAGAEAVLAADRLADRLLIEPPIHLIQRPAR